MGAVLPSALSIRQESVAMERDDRAWVMKLIAKETASGKVGMASVRMPNLGGGWWNEAGREQYREAREQLLRYLAENGPWMGRKPREVPKPPKTLFVPDSALVEAGGLRRH